MSALVVTLFLGMTTACGGGGATGGGQATDATSPPLTVGLAYIPNIQFAPFYVADAKNYFSAAGVEVKLRHHALSESPFDAVSSRREDVVYAGGDEMLQARANGVSVVDVATLQHGYPVALIVREDSPITSPAAMRGHSIGIPGPFGETYFGLLALLQNARLKSSDVEIKNIGFTQIAALTGKKVDGVMGYMNNDLVQFQESGLSVRAMPLSQVVGDLPLISNGLCVRADVVRSRPAEIKALVRATFRGMQDVAADPGRAIEISKKYVPGLRDPKQAATALAILKATIATWQLGSGRQGFNEPAVWQSMADFMVQHGIVAKVGDVRQAYTNDLLP